MSKSPDVIKKILNNIEALYLLHRGDGGKTKFLKNLADALGKPYMRIYEWVISRRFNPQIDNFLLLRAWADKAQANLNQSSRRKFNIHLKEVTSRRNGR